jgi:histidinol dehydrogenase
MTLLRVFCAARDLTPGQERVLFDRSTSTDATITARTSSIIARVRRDGDVALREMAREFDGVALSSLEVSRHEWDAALAALDGELRQALERAARNIATAHRAFLPTATEVETEPGVVLSRRPDPLQRVGIYAPGGRAAYPSSLLMGAIPARVAAVGEVIVCTPPDASGRPSPVVLAAAALAGVDRVFAIGGAGAIAAMAFGTDSVPRVDRIVGPGNAYVAEAKVQLVGSVAIDSPAGPSELLVIADESADPRAVAREMVAQAEHDPRASVVAIVIGAAQAAAIAAALDMQVAAAPRGGIVREALRALGAIVSVERLEDAIVLANRYAAEHLQLQLAAGDVEGALRELRGAGTVFVGASSSVAYGDYMTGANHVLPTGGLARAYSGLSTLDFVRWTTIQRVTPRAAARLAGDVGVFADAEGLPGHAAAARAWSTVEGA